ncbi:kelch repeat-containing protein [Paraburkholderia sp. JHI869]|uniref:kelch repeat-containing protein n=1 Tax=Paraburkholderia sp. JHI869 TaxID=3112959 RepID=UPI003179FEF0
MFLTAMLAAGCHGGGSNSTASVAPTGLTERDPSVVYTDGTAIIPDTFSNSGGAITQCSVVPPLPAGLVLDPQTCAITGTPTTVSNDTIYTVTGSNPEGSDSTRIEIEVKADPVAPESLNYPDAAVIYVINAAIVPNTPMATGGEITQYSVSPALPAGLSLDPQTGVITGTPTAASATALYTVTGSNSVDSVQAQLNIEVQSLIQPPTGLTFSDTAPVFVVGQPVVYDDPKASGGEITSFTVSPALPAGLSLNALTGVISGTPTTAQAQAIYTITGSNSAGSVSASIAIEVSNAVTGEWTPADSMNQARFGHTATLLPNGQVLVAGGAKKQVIASAELYDPVKDTWTSTGSLTQPRQSHTATLLPNGMVLVAGGFKAGAGSEQSTAELYNPATGTWTATGSMTALRDSHTATLLANGMVLVAGGEGKAGALASAELYNPATGSWALTGTMSQARYFHTATLLPNGMVLVAGGTSDKGALASAELYNPATGIWSPAGSMSQARMNFATASLLDGRVLVAGGSDGSNTLSSVELYDPALGMWSTTGSLANARDFLTATTLPGGHVLAAGGLAHSVLSSAELYDPAAGGWSLAASLSQAREQHTATLLPDGRLLVEGGMAGGSLASSELFR